MYNDLTNIEAVVVCVSYSFCFNLQMVHVTPFAADLLPGDQATSDLHS